MSESTRRALLLGVPDPGSEFDVLESVPRDLEKMKEVLLYHSDGTENYDVTDELVEASDNWSVGSFLKSFDDLIDGAEQFIFYFSGHGEATPYGLQLVTPYPQDRYASSFEAGIFFELILRRLNSQDAPKEVLIILDCCYSGAGGDDVTSKERAFRNYTHLREGVTVIASSSRNEPSWAERESMSDFTAAVVECFDEVEGDLFALDLYSRARQKMTAQMPVLRTFGSGASPIRYLDSKSAL